MTACSFPGCSKPIRARTLCDAHYHQWMRGKNLRPIRHREKIDYVGKRFGRLTVVRRVGTKEKQPLWECRCDCGGVTIVQSSILKRGRSRSCGCWKIEAPKSPERRQAMKEKSTRHGYSGTSTHQAWRSMLQRCLNPNVQYWHRYGGRGIKVCPEWNPAQGGSFESFLSAMGEKPDWATGGIDRIDNDGNYEPSNCRWATMKQQRENQ